MNRQRRKLKATLLGLLAGVALLGLLAASAVAAPANDNFANARVISGNLLREGAPGSTKSATKEEGEPNHAGDPGGASVWFSWTPSKTQVVAVTTCGGFDTLLGVYTGTAVNSLTTVASNDEAADGPGCGAPDSEVRFTASAGVKYMIAVDGKGGSSGTVLFKITLPPGNDNFKDADPLPGGEKSTPSNWLATKELGEPEHAGDPGGASVWFRWTAASSGLVELDTCGGAGNPDTLLAVYTGTEVSSLTPIASNDNGAVGCAPRSELTFFASAETKYVIAVDGAGGDEGWFNLHLTE
jgi:hypothetical protein